jgi:hypothetical protein
MEELNSTWDMFRNAPRRRVTGDQSSCELAVAHGLAPDVGWASTNKWQTWRDVHSSATIAYIAPPSSAAHFSIPFFSLSLAPPLR